MSKIELEGKLRRKRRTAFFVAALSLFMVMAGQPSAGALGNETDIEATPTKAHVVDEDHPVLKIGDTVPAALIPQSRAVQNSEPGWDTLTDRAPTGRSVGATYEAQLDDYVDGGPARSESSTEWDPINDCRGALNGSTGRLQLDRFTTCFVTKQAFYWRDSSGKVVGTTSYVQTTAGKTPPDRREAFYEVNLGYFEIDGYYRDMPFPVVGDTKGFNSGGQSNPPCDIINSSNNPKTLQDWRTNGAAVASIAFYQDKSLGFGRDFESHCSISTVTAPGAIDYRDAVTYVRFDSASYLEGSSGGVFMWADPVMTYSTASPNHGEVAWHILTAFRNPKVTTPYVVDKKVPGEVGSWPPLTRLFEDWDSAASAQRQKNITAKNRACSFIRPAEATGLDCDEFPFGSTWEGPAGGGDYSVRYLNSSQNRSAGGTLGVWYRMDRILHRDQFWVRIR
ncbi:NucA/NucB deoxyribonuclease domain-containing protein [Streptomyces zaomyceticus]|uniref:NucA/NucB deoxyribonuclease domain-containing protein n=1 Tax=Streptomyces zaomyceticus TaxID=68286 RepID=A0ABZ1LPS3_9ACTN|nr:NucA/NucB deoxyribonuclease domain-containing protein [Streptomyces zaomyceticus]